MGASGLEAETNRHGISVVIPVYAGEKHLPGLVAEIEELTRPQVTPEGRAFVVEELVLVHDCGPDASARVIRELADQHSWIRPVWLSRNYGQHPATIAGMASTGGDWIVTLDEDGQHDPGEIGVLLDAALAKGAGLVYAAPTNPAPHPLFRRVTSRTAKRIIKGLSGGTVSDEFQSYRLVLGEIGRSIAAYVGPNVYLDVALTWVVGATATAPVTLRSEGERTSSYSPRKLASHFWRMILTSGTRGLRLVSLLGLLCGLGGLALAATLVVARLTGWEVPQGWTSLMVVILLCSGTILFSMGVVAEYVGVVVQMALGRPLYLIVNDPAGGPLGRLGPPRSTAGEPVPSAARR